jgi:transcription initiation factor TFIID subunit 2
MDVDTAIASVIDLEDPPVPAPKVTITNKLATGGPSTKLKLKLGGLTNGNKGDAKNLSGTSRSENKITISARPVTPAAAASVSPGPDNPDDFLLQEVIALEHVKSRVGANGNAHQREATPVHTGNKSNGTSTPKPTIKIKRPLPETSHAPSSKQEAAVKPAAVEKHDTPVKESTSTPINEKKCKEILRILRKIPEAVIFLAPVDPVRDGCPT